MIIFEQQEKKRDLSFVFWSLFMLILTFIVNYSSIVMSGIDLVGSFMMLAGISMTIITDLKGENGSRWVLRLAPKLFYIAVAIRLADAVVGLVK